MQTNGNILLITVVTKKYFEFIHTTDGANGIAHSITQNLLVSVIQNKYTVHWELLSSRSSMESVIMNAFIKGDGLSPLIGTSVRGSNPIPFRLCHCVLSGGWRSDHCNMATYSDQNRKQKIAVHCYTNPFSGKGTGIWLDLFCAQHSCKGWDTIYSAIILKFS